MPVLNYLYTPNDNVYVIETCGVKPGVIVQVRFNSVINANTLEYDVRVEGNAGTDKFVEADIFPDKTTAVTEYETRIP